MKLLSSIDLSLQKIGKGISKIGCIGVSEIGVVK